VLARFSRIAIGEVFNQQKDVVFSFSKGRNLDREHMEAVKQIATERPGADGGLQVTVRGGDHPNVSAYWTRPADTFKFLFLQNTQEGRVGDVAIPHARQSDGLHKSQRINGRVFLYVLITRRRLLLVQDKDGEFPGAVALPPQNTEPGAVPSLRRAVWRQSEVGITCEPLTCQGVLDLKIFEFGRVAQHLKTRVRGATFLIVSGDGLLADHGRFSLYEAHRILRPNVDQPLRVLGQSDFNVFLAEFFDAG
jgi:hypothetical protein